MRIRFLAVVLLLLVPVSLLAQGVTTATLEGTVKGPDGNGLPGVTVTVKSPALMGERSTVTAAGGSSVRQEITLQQGIPIEKAREIVKLIKDSKKKVQASIQGDFLRIAGKDRDTLQDVMQLLRSSDFGIDMQFTNYRTN